MRIQENHGCVDYIYLKILEEYPGLEVRRDIVDLCIRFFIRWVRDSLVMETSAKVYGLGTFVRKEKLRKHRITKEEYLQYDIGFNISAKMLQRIRKYLGTATEAELKELKQREEFRLEQLVLSLEKRLKKNPSKTPSIRLVKVIQGLTKSLNKNLDEVSSRVGIDLRKF